MAKLKHILKRPLCITLCGAMVITSGNFAIPDMPGVVKVSAEEKQEENQNLIDNPSFEGSDDSDGLNVYWWYKDDNTTLSIMNDNGGHNGNYVKIVSLNGTETLLAQNVMDTGISNTNKLESNTEYEFSFWVKASTDYETEVKTKADLAIQKSADEWLAGDTFEFSSSEITVSGEWQEVKGSFKTTDEPVTDFIGIHFKIIGTGESPFSFYADDVSLKKKETTEPGGTTPEKPGEDVKPEKGINILDNPSFDGSTDGWFATGGNIEYVADDSQDATGGCVKLTEKTDTWNSLAQNIKDKVKNKTKYNFSCWVKLGEEYAAESTVKAGLTIQSTEDNKGEPVYDGWGISGNTVTASKDEWREIKGSFMANWTGELEELQFKVADETESAVNNSIYVDNLSITENDVDLSIETDIPSLKDFFALKDPKYDFKVGGVVTEDIVKGDDNKMQLVKKHYNSVTANNEMKPDVIFKGLKDNGELDLDFTKPDEMLDYFKDYNAGVAEKDQIHIRGHVLCWYSQTPETFFKDTEGNLLGKDAMNARLEEYIKQVVTHFKEKYPGLIYCWDVVNEAIIPSDGEKGGLRVKFNDGKTETFYHQIYGDSNEYIINAFKYAARYVEEGVKLFYNDYGETDPVKVQCICDLADAIKEGGGRIDGIGMQSHHSMEAPSAEELYNAIRAYGKHTDEVQITELDMLASKSYDGSDAQKEAELTKQAYRYKEFIDAILKAKDEGTNITALVFWGVTDSDSWLVTDEFSDGRHNMPLLFDEDNKAKPAYWGIVDPSRLSPYIKEENVLESAGKDWTLASPVSVGKNSSMKLLWSNEKLYVQVIVKDATADTDDKVTIYLDRNNVKADNADGIETITINRNEATSTADGYVAEKEIDIPGKAANAKLGFDVVVSDAASGSEECWNDTAMKQAERSKYYGTLTLKPFMVITKGSADIDGVIDSAWNNIEAHRLTVSSNQSVSTTGTVKSMWSEDYLYVLAEIKDAVLNKDNTQAHEQDSFEIFVDENNGKTGSYEADDCQYRINYDNELSFNGQNCNASNIQSATKRTDNGYIVEARIKFNTAKGAENKLIGVDFQINDADASCKRVASINWYDASGMGWSQPAVFGTAKLVGTVIPTQKPEETKKPSSLATYPVYIPGNSGDTSPTPTQSTSPAASTGPVQSTAPVSSTAPDTSTAPVHTPGTTTEVKTDDVTGAVTETTTTIDGNKTTVVEKVTIPDGTQTVTETVTENLDGIIKTTEKLSSSTVNAVIIINTTKKTDGSIISSDAAIHTGTSDIYSKYSAKIQIPESFMEAAKKASVSKISLYVEKPSVDEVKAKNGRKLVVKVTVPDVEGISIGKAVITKKSIETANTDARKLVVKIESKRPSDSYTITIPSSELAKMNSDIDITIDSRLVSNANKDMQEKLAKILSANKVKTNNAYVVSIADNNTKGGIKVSSPVLCKSVAAGGNVYVYHYNKSTGKLEEIANNKRIVLNNGMIGIEGYSGEDYVVTDKELSGKNIVTLLGMSKVSINKAKIKKGSSTKIKVKLPQALVIKPGLKKNVGYGKQSVVITYKSSGNKVAKVSKDGTIKAKGKGKAVISVKIKLAYGKVKTVKKKITVK